MSRFQSILHKHIRKLPNILKFVKIIQYYSTLFNRVLSHLARLLEDGDVVLEDDLADRDAVRARVALLDGGEERERRADPGEEERRGRAVGSLPGREEVNPLPQHVDPGHEPKIFLTLILTRIERKRSKKIQFRNWKS